ncbi:hypothetical protein [Neobacillus niacini]|uniref:hypothetical protein n=1 Tax=Neobacillus niacini TaxID=86668 RepID=UPI002856C841|nr:hypothetical protein [Neobacillus niacini]MDR7001435.1 hypothetical protein [Neobacillus niacini]
MENVPNVRKILLDEEIDEQEFVEIISHIYKKDCYIYVVIPECEQELLNEVSNDFIEVNKFPLPRFFPKEMGLLGYINDSQKRYIYEFYLRSTTMDYLVFSETDVSEQLRKITKNNLDIFKMFEVNKIPHLTIGPDGQWLNVVQF